MLSEHHRTAPKNESRIDIEDENDLEYWSRRWCVKVERIVNAVKKIGNDSRLVNKYLGLTVW